MCAGEREPVGLYCQSHPVDEQVLSLQRRIDEIYTAALDDPSVAR